MALIRDGLRRASCEAGTAAAAARWGWENEVISSITVGLVTGQEVAASLAHPNPKPQIAAQVQQVLQICCRSHPQGPKHLGRHLEMGALAKG